MYLIFDTETTDIAQFNMPLDHPAQPHIVQLACVLFDDEFHEAGSFCSLIKPNGWDISPGAFNRHHLSLDRCKQYGIPIENALRIFDSYADCADKVIAHNLKFDAFLIDIEQSLREHNPVMYDWTHNGICTMLESTDICKLPKTSNRGGKYKWPKLEEAYEFFYKMPLNNAHDALADCRACGLVLKALIQHGAVDGKRTVAIA